MEQKRYIIEAVLTGGTTLMYERSEKEVDGIVNFLTSTDYPLPDRQLAKIILTPVGNKRDPNKLHRGVPVLIPTGESVIQVFA